MNFMVEVENSICRIEDYNDYKYWYGRKAFTRVRKWSFMDYVLFVLVNKGRSSAIDIEEYVKERWDDESKIISKQALSKQRLKIKPKIFKDMNMDFISDVFNSSEFEHDFKDYTILIVDGSDFQLPNIKITKEEFNVASDTLVYTQAPSVKASMLIDAKYNIVVDAILGDFKSNERELVKQHISNIEDKINLEKTVIIFNRGYISLELMLFLENKGIKYLFRSNERYYQNEILTMKSRDETVQLEINTNRTQNIKDKNIKKQALNLEYYQTRISKPLLDNGVTEILFTNISESEADIHKLKELYKMRWEIELNYEKIKNKLRIENFSGKRRTIIEQDFYSQIYIFNLQMAIQNKAQKELEPENKELREKHDKEKRPNTNLEIGRLKNKLTKINPETDKQIAMKILNTHQHKKEEHITEDLLKKYISIARTIKPELTHEAKQEITEFFCKTRQLAQENHHPIPVTTRQLEAIIRLSKASARIRLSETVNTEDVERAKKLQKYCMKHVGFDTETSTLEADKIMGNPTTKERQELDQIQNKYKNLQKK